MSLTLYTALVASGALVSVSGATTEAAADGVALQGHAKRYMRINEYLFHGTQKGTAVAMRANGSALQVEGKTLQVEDITRHG